MIGFAFSLPSLAFAEEAAKKSPGLLSTLSDNAFELTIIFIFLAAIIGAILRSRARDRTLCDFQGFRATLEFKGGKLVWGDLRVFPNGVTLRYAKPHKDEDGHIETSTILYKDEFGTIQAIYRCHDDLTPFNMQRRLKDIERTYNPSVFRRARRSARNAAWAACHRGVGGWRSGAYARVEGNEIRGTSWGRVPGRDGAEVEVGDGVVVAGTETWADFSTEYLSVADNVIADSARAGLLVMSDLFEVGGRLALGAGRIEGSGVVDAVAVGDLRALAVEGVVFEDVELALPAAP